MESVELRDFGVGVFSARGGGNAEHSVGKLFATDGGDLDFGVGDYCAASALSYHRNLCGVLHCVCVCAELYHWESVAVGGRAFDGADVSAVYIFYDYGPEDYGEVEEVAVHRGGDCGFCGDDFAAGSGGLRAVLCAVFGWAGGAFG